MFIRPVVPDLGGTAAFVMMLSWVTSTNAGHTKVQSELLSGKSLLIQLFV